MSLTQTQLDALNRYHQAGINLQTAQSRLSNVKEALQKTKNRVYIEKKADNLFTRLYQDWFNPTINNMKFYC